MRASEFSNSKLVIFDIDDTLVNTDTKVDVRRDGRVVKSLNSHDFTHYQLQPGEEFDFGRFRDAREFFTQARPIPGMIRQLKNDINTGNRVIMLTARSDFNDRDIFLDTFRRFGIDMSKVHVYRAGNLNIKAATEEKKKIILQHLLGKEHYDKVIMYDDSVPNLNAFLSLKQDYPWSKFYAWHVDRDGQASEYHRTDIKVDESILVTDVPKEEWLDSKIRYAQERGRNSHGAPYMGATTAYVRNPDYVELPVSLLARIPGAQGEQKNVRHKDLEAITKIMQDTGKLPLTNSGEEYKPFIGVAWNGEPWTLEGNHRIMAAARLGWKTLPVEVKYFDGGERVRSGPLYPEKIGLKKPEPGSTVIMNREAVDENFADGKKPGRKGLAKRVGVNCKQSVSKLRNIAKNSSGERQRMAHWCANMKSGKNK